jgi:uncharacterized integral membrane protein
MLPLAAAIIVFSVNNRTEVILDLWPLGVVTAPLPVFAVVLASMVVGFVAGGLTAWNSAGRTRRRARAEAKRADQAERDLVAVQSRINDLQTAEIPDAPPTRTLPSSAA